MYVSKFTLISTMKSSLKWMFFCLLYPYVVMSTVYGGGASVTALLFSYITIVPTLLLIKLIKVSKEKSLDLNEYFAGLAKNKFTDEEYSKVLIGLKIARKISLVLLGLVGIKLLFTVFNVSSLISPSLNGFLIALLQVYYMVIVIARIKYEA